MTQENFNTVKKLLQEKLRDRLSTAEFILMDNFLSSVRRECVKKKIVLFKIAKK